MRSQKIVQGLALGTAAALTASLLSACAPSQQQTHSVTDASATASPAPGGSLTPTPARTARPTVNPAATPLGDETADPAPAIPVPVAPVLCKAGGLSATTSASGGGAAGSVYLKLNLTNTGPEPCILRGFPGVSLVAHPTSSPIGAPAIRDTSAPITDVLLAPGQTGSAVLRYTRARIYMDCALVQAAGYRIYPPEDTKSLFLTQPTNACSNANIALLTIGAFEPV